MPLIILVSPRSALFPRGQQTSYTYDALGRVRQMTDGNNAATTYSYDDANRLTQIKHQNSQLLTRYTYTLNPVGNRTQVVEAQTQGLVADLTSIQYTYDPLHRLTYATYNGSYLLPTSFPPLVAD